jgi:hypothetical protein
METSGSDSTAALEEAPRNLLHRHVAQLMYQRYQCMIPLNTETVRCHAHS